MMVLRNVRTIAVHGKPAPFPANRPNKRACNIPREKVTSAHGIGRRAGVVMVTTMNGKPAQRYILRATCSEHRCWNRLRHSTLRRASKKCKYRLMPPKPRKKPDTTDNIAAVQLKKHGLNVNNSANSGTIRLLMRKADRSAGAQTPLDSTNAKLG